MHDSVCVQDISKLGLGVSRVVGQGKETSLASTDFRKYGTYHRENTWKEEAERLT